MSTLPKEIFARKGLSPLPHAGLASVSEDPSVPDQPLPHKNLRQRCLREYSPLDWNEFFDKKVDVMVGQDKFCVYLKGTSGPLFYMLHGGGYSGLTWSCLAEELSKLLECRILAPDLRGHGNTETKDETDFSSETQVADIVAIHDALFKDECIPTILVGHSMGGALAIHAAVSGNMVNVVGLVVVDVVEGTALEALSSMTRLLADRPRQFPSIESAIEWCLRTRATRNLRAARISMPSQLRRDNDHYTWRIDLTKTEPYWIDWFKGCSQQFLRCHAQKVLILAGADRLDKDLMVAQMQGKFQYTILPKVGHVIQEDSPASMAETLARFVERFKLTRLI